MVLPDEKTCLHLPGGALCAIYLFEARGGADEHLWLEAFWLQEPEYGFSQDIFGVRACDYQGSPAQVEAHADLRQFLYDATAYRYYAGKLHPPRSDQDCLTSEKGAFS
jgi:hypothetical protein